MTSDIGIQFMGSMVRGIIERRKIMTRRLLISQPLEVVKLESTSQTFLTFDARATNRFNRMEGRRRGKGNACVWKAGKGISLNELRRLAPYGGVGDRLWVRESIRYNAEADNHYYMADNAGVGEEIHRRLKPKSVPSILMSRFASRISLAIVDVRVEQLGEITEDDAIDEGIEPEGDGWKSYETILSGKHAGKPHPHSVAPNRRAVQSFAELWDSLHADRGLGWKANPWVFVYSFKLLDEQKAAA